MDFIKRNRIWIALVLLVLPVALRGLWFYRWFAIRPEVKAPDYTVQTVPQPPVSTTAPDDVAAVEGKVVLLDKSHTNQYTAGEIEVFTAALGRRGARVELVEGEPYLAARLKYASAYVVLSPMDKFTVEEITLLRNFVASGGRLIVFTDPTRGQLGMDWFTGNMIDLPDADVANALLAPYGITINGDYLYNLVVNEGNFRNVLFEEFGEDALTAGLKRIAFYGAHSLQAGTGTALVTGDGNTFSSFTDAAGTGQVAAALSADGNVLAFGDFSFLIPPYNTVADNSVLINHIADFALGGKRTHTVADFPFVFDRNVAVVPTGGLQMNADILGPLAGLQRVLQSNNTTLTINADAPEKSDLLVIGTLPAEEDLAEYLKPFELETDESGNVILPGFGTIPSTGIGFLLYQPGKGQNTLIVLTSAPEDLPSMISLLAGGDLSACVVQEEIGICSIGSGGDYYTEPVEEAVPEGTPEATPTPVG